MQSTTDQSDQDKDPLDEDRRAAGHGEMNRRLHSPGQHLTGDMNADLRFAAGKIADEAS